MAFPEDAYSDDPSNETARTNAAPNSPAPSPSPFADTPATTQVSTGSTTSAPTDPAPADPPPDFIAAINNALMFRLGPTKYSLIPSADKKALIAKVWQDPSIQSAYVAAGGRLRTDRTGAGRFGRLIHHVPLGQGNGPTLSA